MKHSCGEQHRMHKNIEKSLNLLRCPVGPWDWLSAQERWKASPSHEILENTTRARW